MTALSQKLGIETPIVQAPMAGTATPALAAAVSNAGGLGSIGLGTSTVDAARSLISELRAATDRPFNVNLFCHRPPVADSNREAAWLAYLAPSFHRFGAEPPATLEANASTFVENDAMLAMLLKERPPIVSFHFGVPSPERLDALRSAGVLLMASATNLIDAKTIEAAGIDVVIAQGIEAGGHRGLFDPAAPDQGLGVFALTRLFARELSLPVISAGGIMDGAGIAACLALGAGAAQLGTAFVSCPESAADDGYRAALLSKPARRTALSAAISGRPARGLFNELMALGAQPDAPPLPDFPIPYEVANALNAAAKTKGNSDFAVHWAGQAAGLSRAMPAADLVALLRAELNDAIANLCG